MTPELQRRIQDWAVGAIGGALAVGLLVWRDVSVLKTDMGYVKRDLAVVSQFFQAQFPGWVADLSTPKAEAKQ